ncbi:hypothetical protein B0H13DRAFT_2013294 [Mycena leptocephala]|nr:hypothetical protein B0H13DRAFT_2013294 [Mycena leptocephala]
MPGAIPPTTYSLPHAQRVRLLRSTRKVESILGETPLLADSVCSSTATLQTVSKDAPSFAAASTTQSRASSRPVLIVRLPSVSSIGPGTTNSPLSATSGISFNSPVSALPTPRAAAEEEMTRRRKMAAKLSRTLGENIPPELVLPSTSNSGPTRRPRRASSMTSLDVIGTSSRRSCSARGGVSLEPISDGTREGSFVASGSPEEASLRSSGETETSDSARRDLQRPDSRCR